MLKYTPFLITWAMLNAVRVAHGLPELLYGEAREIIHRRTER